MAHSGRVFTLTVGNLPTQTFAVVEFTLNEALSTLFSLEASLTSADPDIDFADVLDNDATLTVYRDGQPERCVSGIVTRFEQETTGRHRSHYSLTVHPALWRAGLRVNSRIFQHQSVTDMIETLLKENGIKDIAYTLNYEHPVREFCVQYDESDLAFLQRLLADEGIFYYFEFHQDQNGRTIFFADTCLALGNRFSVPYNPVPDPQGAQPSINQFRWREQVGVQGVFLKDRTFKNPPWAAEYNFYESKTGHQRTDLPSYYHYDFPGRYKDERGEKMSRYRLEALRRNDLLGRGQSDCFFLWPGILFTLTNHPKEKFNVPWQVIQISHHGQQPQADETRAGETGTTLTNRFTFGDHSRSWRPSPYPKPRIDGLQIATVVGPEGEEIFCDAYGRVRVQFAWDPYGKFNDQSSCWIRVSQAWAGKGWGMITIPRVGQEVLVDFLHGDPDQPIIIGRTYHANNIVPNRLPMAKTQMSIRSKTHKGEGFNELRFEDEKDREEVFIHAQKNLAIQVRNSRDERVNYNRTTRIGHDDELAIARNRKITVDGQQAHKTTGNYLAQIDGDKALQVKGDVAQKIQGVFSVDANGDLTVQRGSTISLRVGGNFIVIHAGGVDIKGPAINLNSGGSPGDLLQPANPAILQAAASAGSMFVAHCPMKDNN
ncbi:type VI secretion system tip protein VgrG [Photorhabdus khanii]|uniref:Type VI secretion system tip protein VgrG n=1 Tax=Photorhabdus khanii TaxID=1004150 RepID=A0A7C9KSW3_9GAMM|nr:type VI secretion system tip protein VgrG [Photorhabdus khanii]MQL49303.1 type VI secretion system tip protein VgrG [Photorhabdus khanii]